jgi:hypothetical protein
MNAEYVVNDWRAVLCGYTWPSLDSSPGTNIFWDLQSLTFRSSPTLQLRRASDLIFWRHQCHSPAATRISLNIWPPSYDSLLLVCRTKSSFDYALPSISRKMTDGLMWREGDPARHLREAQATPVSRTRRILQTRDLRRDEAGPTSAGMRPEGGSGFSSSISQSRPPSWA